MSLPELSSGHKYSETEAVALDNLTVYWSESNISKEDLRSRLDEEAYAGLSEQDKNEIVEQISSANPHNNPTETVPVEEETKGEEESVSESSDNTESNSQSPMEHEQAMKDKFFGGSGLGNGTGASVPLQLN